MISEEHGAASSMMSLSNSTSQTTTGTAAPKPRSKRSTGPANAQRGTTASKKPEPYSVWHCFFGFSGLYRGLSGFGCPGHETLSELRGSKGFREDPWYFGLGLALLSSSTAPLWRHG